RRERPSMLAASPTKRSRSSLLRRGNNSLRTSRRRRDKNFSTAAGDPSRPTTPRRKRLNPPPTATRDSIPPSSFTPPTTPHSSPTIPSVTPAHTQPRINEFTQIPKKGKTPPMKGWEQKFDVSEEEIRRWEKTYPRARNTGVLAKFAPGFDIDITIEAAAKAAEDKAREFLEEQEHTNIHARFGAPPKRLIPLRTDEPFTKLYRAFKAPDGSEHKLEMLGDGQQYVVDGIHPDTRKPYTWFGSELTAIKRENLPYIRRDDAEQLLDAIAKVLIEEHGFVLTGTSKAVDSSKQLDFTQKNTGSNGGEDLTNFKVPEGFKDLP